MDNSRPAGGPDPAAHRWGPDRRLRWACLAAAAGGVAWRLIDPNPENRLVAAALAIVGLAVALILMRIRVRLAADARGLTVTGPLHARTFAWADVATITTPQRGRFGRRGASLEIDVRADGRSDRRTRGPDVSPGYDAVRGGAATDGPRPEEDTELLAFGAFELGADPSAVGRALMRLRPTE